jgi:RND superfamily putative drug exporter
MFSTLGTWCHDHRRLVVGLWFVVLLTVIALNGAVGSAYSSTLELPDVESKQGFDIIERDFEGRGGSSNATIVFEAPQGVEDPSVRSAMTEYFDAVTAEAGVDVRSPYDPDAQGQIATSGARAGEVAFARLDLSSDLSFDEMQQIGDRVQDLQPAVDGVRIEFGGEAFTGFEPPSSELLGLAFAIVILILAFGSVLAMGLPIGVALAGVGVGSALIALLSNVVTTPDFAVTLGVMIGIGVGIDYALFIVTRFREQLRAGHTTGEAVAIAVDTSGRAVAFAGFTVVISLMGMLLMGVNMVRGLGIGAAVVVLVTMVASLSLLPALLGFAGGRVDVTRWRGLVAAGLVAVALVGMGLSLQPLLVGIPLALVVLVASFAVAPLRREVPRREPKAPDRTFAYRWSRLVQRHPWRSLAASAGVLLLLAVPVLGLRLGFSDQGNDPVDSTTRQAYDLMAEGFGPGYNGPLLVVAELPEGTSPEQFTGVTDALAATDGVAIASAPNPNDPTAPTAVLWQVVPTTAPQDAATTDLVHRLRDETLPAATAGTGLDVSVTGQVATQIDFSSYLAARLPLFFGVVLGLSFLLLMAVFRSLLVPLKAVIMNLLSIGAAYGVLVMVFQWGWLGGLLGLEGAPIEPFMPMMLFAIVFGLSMDYEVFLLSRIREEWTRTGDPHTSVADGLAATARVITAAAAIMVFVFGSFLLEPDRVIKLMGAGLAVAVLLDATVVRMLLVPATMELLGSRNWWIPRWLDRVLPRLDVEGPHVDEEEGPDGPEEPEVPRELVGVG